MKKISLIATGLLSVMLSASILASDPDTRQTLQLNAMQRHHILSEMRALLQGTQAIIQSLSEEDMAAVAKHARALGTTMPHKGENHLRSVLPEAFMKMGMSVHHGFDQIAAEAESTNNAGAIQKRLSDTMQTCVACHAAYQIRVERSAQGSQAHPPHGKHRREAE
ncbi:cytochrome c [Nitrosomonas halophila]|jgi:cytochrome c553|uniref:Cytochrome C n=1 Tax=Nitrosomonas halophila TaxID=44576 RepID=A0A1H3D210_9PROT|nr:cytochrome c [Nitrosomonas halophila]SDX60376.1 Cytochrome C' [Nitrosomonas halophila]